MDAKQNLGQEKERVDRPLVSIICVFFNAAVEVRPLLESIVEGADANCELIVIDGGSTDGTVEALQEFAPHMASFVSEPDEGIYSAMNKGISRARGEYIFHLNSGDRLLKIPVEELKQCLEEDIQVASFCVLVDGELFTPHTGFRLRIDNTWHHQGTFYRRSSHPGYDPSYRVFGDLNANQRMLRAGFRVRLFPGIVADHAHNGVSAVKKHFGEVYKSIRETFGAEYLPIAFLWFKYKGMRRRVQCQLKHRLTAKPTTGSP
jgi:glycosyltransferase involved in cell wall biosynthesis